MEELINGWAIKRTIDNYREINNYLNKLYNTTYHMSDSYICVLPGESPHRMPRPKPGYKTIDLDYFRKYISKTVEPEPEIIKIYSIF